MSADESPDTDERAETPWPAVAYRGIILVAAVFGVLAVVVGSIGLYTALTDGPNESGDANVLGEFACERFEGDPEIGHEASYAIDLTVTSPDTVESFDGRATGGNVDIELQVAGRLLDASARTVEGTSVPVEQTNNTVRVTRSETTPFRLWIDTLSEDAVRMQLDICP
jgi:hypothetical protein